MTGEPAARRPRPPALPAGPSPRAGLTLVCVHVDALQPRPDIPPGATRERDLNALRDAIALLLPA